MLKPLSALVFAAVLLGAAPGANADNHRHERGVRGHDTQGVYVADRYALTRAERRDLRYLRSFHSRHLSRAERRYLRDLERRAVRARIVDRRVLRRPYVASYRFRHHSRGHYCRLRTRHFHDGYGFYGTAGDVLATAAALHVAREVLDD